MTIDDLVLRAFDNLTKIVSTNEIKEKYPELHWGKNGLGDRFAQKKFNYTCILSSGKLNVYSENTDDEIPKDLLEMFQKNEAGLGSGIIGIFVHSKKLHSSQQRPIRKDIIKEITKDTCLHCDEKETVCDHKNDLYNDLRVLNTTTQEMSDFQRLCNRCNLKKRQIAIDERQNQKLCSAKKMNEFRQYDFPFPWEKKVYDEKDIKCKEDTYWYDIEEFRRKVRIYVRYREHLNCIKLKRKDYL